MFTLYWNAGLYFGERQTIQRNEKNKHVYPPFPGLYKMWNINIFCNAHRHTRYYFISFSLIKIQTWNEKHARGKLLSYGNQSFCDSFSVIYVEKRLQRGTFDFKMKTGAAYSIQSLHPPPPMLHLLCESKSEIVLILRKATSTAKLASIQHADLENFSDRLYPLRVYTCQLVSQPVLWNRND